MKNKSKIYLNTESDNNVLHLKSSLEYFYRNNNKVSLEEYIENSLKPIKKINSLSSVIHEEEKNLFRSDYSDKRVSCSFGIVIKDKITDNIYLDKIRAVCHQYLYKFFYSLKYRKHQVINYFNNGIKDCSLNVFIGLCYFNDFFEDGEVKEFYKILFNEKRFKNCYLEKGFREVWKQGYFTLNTECNSELLKLFAIYSRYPSDIRYKDSFSFFIGLYKKFKDIYLVDIMYRMSNKFISETFYNFHATYPKPHLAIFYLKRALELKGKDLPIIDGYDNDAVATTYNLYPHLGEVTADRADFFSCEIFGNKFDMNVARKNLSYYIFNSIDKDFPSLFNHSPDSEEFIDGYITLFKLLFKKLKKEKDLLMYGTKYSELKFD